MLSPYSRAIERESRTKYSHRVLKKKSFTVLAAKGGDRYHSIARLKIKCLKPVTIISG